MDLQRIVLIGALLFTLMLLWQAWQEDYVRPKTEPVAQQTQPGPQPHAQDVPAAASAGKPAPGDTPQTTSGLATGDRVLVTTDVFRVEIDTVGGDLRQVALLDYPVSLEQPDTPVKLLNDRPAELFIAQSGLLSAGADSPAPNHHARFEAAQPAYVLADGEQSLTVDLVWRGEGVEVVKSYTFRRGDHLIDLDYMVRNTGSGPWQGHMYRQFQRTKPAGGRHLGIYTYTGGVIYSQEEKYEKVDFDEMAESDLSRSIQGGWAAMIQHYFLAAWVPPQEQKYTYYSKAPGNERYVLGLMGPATAVAPGESGHFSSQLYVGPKLQERLEAIAQGLELTVDYGVLTIIAKPLYWLLEMFHSLVGNWGFAIILLTVLVKGVFYKLSETSYKSMAHMRKVQPRMAALKEKFGDDKEKLNQAMMKLYKEEKINPLGGCLPILVQIPVFIALYWVLLESVELRQAPFILWINDLSTKDPFYVLPILMGATMLIQHRLNPSPMDPIQARVMMLLPIVFTFFFAFFPAGLVLYWVVNNTLSILQQWYITRHVVKA